ncbi:MarR family transcriptional regulator [Catenulispora pinisilvae]|uniref:MarR family transcriptional regulator n=1 Tax=Catenulispora pinisilvae TaxID=2705253 RepID=UPI001891326A|nr:helix-turn-helix domain-containing protein [Catenulispora pinisilvae]
MPSTVNTPDREPNPMRTSLVPELSLTAAQRRVAGALAEVHDATVIEVTALVDVSKSSVAKALTLLERTNAAIRTVREEDGVRDADLWSPGPALGALLFTASSEPRGLDRGDAPGEPGEGVADAFVHVPDDAPECSVSPVSSAGDADATSDGEPESETAAAPPVDSAAVAEVGVVVASEPGEPAPDGRGRRLASGELAAMVAPVLEAHPDIEYTPTMLSHLLDGRSAGAIHNVLEKMVASGAAVRTSDKPKRYRHAVVEASKPA